MAKYLFFIGMFFVLSPAEATALSCIPPTHSVLAICDYETKECSRGFTIEYRSGGNACDYVPYIHHRSNFNLERQLFMVLEQNAPTLLDSVRDQYGYYAPAVYEFKINDRCLSEWYLWEDCSKQNQIAVVFKPDFSNPARWWSDSTSYIEEQRKRWGIIISQEKTGSLRAQVIGVAIITAVGLFLMAIPHLLSSLFSSLRRKRRKKYLVGLLLQLPLGIILYFLMMVSLQWTYTIWNSALLITAGISVAVLVWEVAYVFYLTIKKSSELS